MSKMVSRIFILCITVTLFSIAIYAMYLHAYGSPYIFPHNLWIFPAIKNQYEIVKTGNSHADEGITFDHYKLTSLSLTGAAYSFDYDLANLKMYSRQIKKGAVIIIDVSQISFSQQTENRQDDLQATFYDGKLSPFLIPHLKVEDYVQSQIFPFLRAGFLWRQQYSDEIQRRISAEERKVTQTSTVTGIVNNNNYAQVDMIQNELATTSATDDARLVDSMNFIFNKWYNSGGFGTQYFASNRRDLEQLIIYCLQQKWRPVLVTVPVSKVLQVGLLPDFMKVNLYDNMQKTNLHGVEYMDFTNLTGLIDNSSLYRDSDHLNKNGAEVFSYVLLQRLINEGYVPKSADGYE